jgi:hypothetical protein
MAVNSWSTVAPIGPYASEINGLPLVWRDIFLKKLSKNASPMLASRDDATGNLDDSVGVLPLAVKKAGLVVTFFAPKGTSVDWGDTGTTAATAADGDVSHTYAGAGTYQVVTANLLSNAVGKAAVTV